MAAEGRIFRNRTGCAPPATVVATTHVHQRHPVRILARHGGGLGHHALDGVRVQVARRVGDGHVGLGLGVLVLRGDGEDSVGVQREGDVDLGLAALAGGHAVQAELAQQVVGAADGALALVHRHVNGGLQRGVEGIGKEG